MRFISQLAAALAVMLTLGLVTALSAQATPEYYHCVKGAIQAHTLYEIGCLTMLGGGGYEKAGLTENVAFSSKIGTTEFVGSETVKCSGGSSSGDVAGSAASGVVVRLTGCEDTSRSSCKVKSPTGSTGEIISAKLKGKLGFVAEAEAKSKTGISLEPETSGSRELTTIVWSCLENLETPVLFKTTSSRIIAEVTPVNTFGTTGEVILKRGESGQQIKTFEGASETGNVLQIGGSTIGVTQLTDTFTFTEMLEVFW
jgi:hypothetical protein